MEAVSSAAGLDRSLIAGQAALAALAPGVPDRLLNAPPPAVAPNLTLGLARWQPIR